LHRGEDVYRRQANYYGLKELGRVEDGFARGIWSVAGVKVTCGNFADGLALLLAMLVLFAFKWM
jgi:hypothetical protein